MIEVRNVVKQFGTAFKIDDFSFDVYENQHLALLGKSGAGKSSILNMISGFLPYDQGSIRIHGVDIKRFPLEAKKHIGYLTQEPIFCQYMTIQEYFQYLARLRGLKGKPLKDEVARLLSLLPFDCNEEIYARTLQNLEMDVKQLIQFAGVFAGNPDVILLDEPTGVLSPLFAKELRKMYAFLKDHTVIFSSRNFREVSFVCDRAIVLNNGTIVSDCRLSDLTNYVHDINRIKIKLAANRKQAYDLFQSVPDIIDIEDQPDFETDAVNFVVLCHAGTDIRKPLWKISAELGLPILEMRQMNISLEDIFLQLTSNMKG